MARTYVLTYICCILLKIRKSPSLAISTCLLIAYISKICKNSCMKVIVLPSPDKFSNNFRPCLSLFSGRCFSDREIPAYSAVKAFAKSNWPSSDFQQPHVSAWFSRPSDFRSASVPIVSRLEVVKKPARLDKITKFDVKSDKHSVTYHFKIQNTVARVNALQIYAAQ